MRSDGAAARTERRWLKRFGRSGPDGDVRLLCFHHAGGTAGVYRRWAEVLPPAIEPVGVQLPGRADRFAESAFTRMEPLLDALVEVAGPLLDRPFACYGASMGARVAWAFTQALRDRALPLPRVLFVASSAAPTEAVDWPWERHWDRLEGYLEEMGGTPPEVLAEPDLLRALVPTLRADLEVLSYHSPRPAPPLDVPIHGFAGAKDPNDPPEKMRPWAQQTTAGFALDVVDSGHFYDIDAEDAVIRTIAATLRPSAG